MRDADDEAASEAVSSMFAPSQENLMAGEAEHFELAEAEVDKYQAWLKDSNGPLPQVFHAGGSPPEGVDCWVSYQGSIPGSRCEPDAHGMARWVDEAGCQHVERSRTRIEYRLTDQQKRELGL